MPASRKSTRPTGWPASRTPNGPRGRGASVAARSSRSTATRRRNVRTGKLSAGPVTFNILLRQHRGDAARRLPAAADRNRPLAFCHRRGACDADADAGSLAARRASRRHGSATPRRAAARPRSFSGSAGRCRGGSCACAHAAAPSGGIARWCCRSAFWPGSAAADHPAAGPPDGPAMPPTRRAAGPAARPAASAAAPVAKSHRRRRQRDGAGAADRRRGRALRRGRQVGDQGLAAARSRRLPGALEAADGQGAGDGRGRHHAAAQPSSSLGAGWHRRQWRPADGGRQGRRAGRRRVRLLGGFSVRSGALSRRHRVDRLPPSVHQGGAGAGVFRLAGIRPAGRRRTARRPVQMDRRERRQKPGRRRLGGQDGGEPRQPRQEGHGLGNLVAARSARSSGSCARSRA